MDFFSIGTNDLIQYSIAVDRMNERVAHLYEPSHPAVVRLLKMVADAAHANDIWVGVCGEMAGEFCLTPLLLGLGMDELSAGATLVPRVKSAVQRLAMTECEQLVEEVLKLDTPLRSPRALHRDGARRIIPSCSAKRTGEESLVIFFFFRLPTSPSGSISPA